MMENNRIQALDTLRAIAIILVVGIHTAQVSTSSILRPTMRFVLNYGASGVQLFFIVSAFTILLTFGNEISKLSTLCFWIRRIFRIVPMFWIALIISLFIDRFEPRYWAPNGISWIDVGLTASFLHWIKPDSVNSVVPGGWSIGIEMLFYAIFPLLHMLYRWNSSALYVVICTVHIGAIIAKKFVLTALFQQYFSAQPTYLVDQFLDLWLPNQMICFGFGFILFQLIIEKVKPTFGLAVLVFAALQSEFGVRVLGLFFLAYFVVTTAYSSRILSVIGNCSYSVYIVHFLVINLWSRVQGTFEFSLPFELNCSIVVIVSVLLSNYLTKRFVEDKFIRLGRRIVRRLTTPAT
jgi:peptidoglycan/LPS O-acetylase OafA/YrhL